MTNFPFSIIIHSKIWKNQESHQKLHLECRGFPAEELVYCYLASPVMQRWVDLVETKYMASHRKVPGEVFKRADLVKPTLARISLLDRGQLMEAYFDSTIPVKLLDEDPELASRGYPK